MSFPLGGVSELDGQKQGITFLIFQEQEMSVSLA